MSSTQRLLLITPPFTQLNTPYPATTYLKGFLNTKGIYSHQSDLGIEVILKIFSKEGLTKIFEYLNELDLEVSDNINRMYQLQDEYIHTINPVISFLQNKNPTLAHDICSRRFLPEAARFETIEDLDWAFGTMGLQDKAKHLATLYLEDLGDLITEMIDPHFGFSRYAERLGRTASSFDTLNQNLQKDNTIITDFLIELLDEKIKLSNPTLVCISIPFPGNLFAAFKCGQYIKSKYSAIKIAIGGGYPNTELRSISDPRVFDYIDFITLDDGEKPLELLIEYLNGNREITNLKRTFARLGDEVIYHYAATEKDVPQKDTGTPDNTDLLLTSYISVIEVANSMHSMWSDGRWNKLTLAHGCYWGKCTFCDVSLDYIRHYEPLTAVLICDRIEELILQTGNNGFHFVDEAAPPGLLKELCLEILRRKIIVTWWTNIRFEKHFTPDLAYLMKAAGCIAVAGGLEVASDRLLQLMKKGVTVAQVAQVADALTNVGIMVHAYLMYGFPTETAAETIDALEMVRQMFEQDVISSGFWHQFAMTAHSPVGKDPEAFNVRRVGPDFAGFAENDLYHEDPNGANHEQYSEGLKKSLFNFMQGAGYDLPLKTWFDFKVPSTTIKPNFIELSLLTREEKYRHTQHIVWLGYMPAVAEIGERKKSKMLFEFYNKISTWELEFDPQIGAWLEEVFQKILLQNETKLLFTEFKESYTSLTGKDFEPFWYSKEIKVLRENGLVVL
jgi:radical SAM superfamily enzyme YgiQ (UPF0313 family)